MRVDGYCPHFPEEETKARRGVLACPRAQLEVGNLDSVSPLGSKIHKVCGGLYPPAVQDWEAGGAQQTHNHGQRVDGAQLLFRGGDRAGNVGGKGLINRKTAIQGS